MSQHRSIHSYTVIKRFRTLRGVSRVRILFIILISNLITIHLAIYLLVQFDVHYFYYRYIDVYNRASASSKQWKNGVYQGSFS